MTTPTATDAPNATITITMTDRAPLRVTKDTWPLIASASGHDGQHASQANHAWYLNVRQHADGRSLVYGAHDEGPGGSHSGFRPRWAGFLTPSTDGVVRAIRRVEELLGVPGLGDECISDLPAEQLE